MKESPRDDLPKNERMSRRDFLKAAAITSAASALGAGSVPKSAEALAFPKASLNRWLAESSGTPEEQLREARRANDSMIARWEGLGDEKHTQYWTDAHPFSFFISILGKMHTVRKSLDDGLVVECDFAFGQATNVALLQRTFTGDDGALLHIRLWTGDGAVQGLAGVAVRPSLFSDVEVLKEIFPNVDDPVVAANFAPREASGPAADFSWRLWRGIVKEFTDYA